VWNKCQLCDNVERNSVFIAYLDVRSDKSETNWLLVDYEAWLIVCITRRVAVMC
jgi:hypothetical protein